MTTIGDPRPAGQDGPAGDQRPAGSTDTAGDPRKAGEATLKTTTKKTETKPKAESTKTNGKTS